MITAAKARELAAAGVAPAPTAGYRWDDERKDWVPFADDYRDLMQTVIAQAEQLERVRALADKWEHGALRWADPLPVPPAVGQLRAALAGVVDPEEYGK